jgi:hypothetical protein
MPLNALEALSIAFAKVFLCFYQTDVSGLSQEYREEMLSCPILYH